MIDINKTSLRFGTIRTETLSKLFSMMMDKEREHGILYISNLMSVIFPNNYADTITAWTWDDIEELMLIIFSAYYQTYRKPITDAELGHLVVSLAQIHNSMKQKIINRGSNDYPVFDNSEE